MARVVIDIPDSVDLSKVTDIKLCLRYYKDNNEYSYVTDGFTVQEERPKGEWIIIDDTEQFIAKCSICGRIEDSRMIKDYPFCHCGADMRGGADMRKPNCVRCDHFGKCEGCEKRDEE